MKPLQRQFLHVLAEDYGLDSESQDPEPHRHVVLFKGPRFVSAPNKSLLQCLKLSRTAPRLTPAATPAAKATVQEPYNALLLSAPRFGLMVNEVESALASDLSSHNIPGLTFSTNFLPADEVVIKVVTKTTVASIASGPAPTPLVIESTLAAIRPKVAKTISNLGIAGGVALCHADNSLNVTRREGDAAAGSGGWSTVASRAAARPRQLVTTPVVQKAPSSFLALRKIKKKEEPEPVEEDWEAAAKKLDDVPAGA